MSGEFPHDRIISLGSPPGYAWACGTLRAVIGKKSRKQWLWKVYDSQPQSMGGSDLRKLGECDSLSDARAAVLAILGEAAELAGWRERNSPELPKLTGKQYIPK